MQAIDTGTERLTVELLDGVEINLGNVPGRDPSAGEIPPIPPQPATAKAKQTSKPTKRPRSTVFDDHGLPAAADT